MIDDLGSGALAPAAIHGDEPDARGSVAAGADVACFSADKLLGGPQAGILVGRADAIAAARRHPLARALRLDKLRIAALEATLTLHRDPAAARRRIPALAMLADSADARMARAQALAAAIGAGAEAVPTVGRVGGGALPLAELPSAAVTFELDGPAKFIRRVAPPRTGPPGGHPDPRGARAAGRPRPVGAGPRGAPGPGARGDPRPRPDGRLTCGSSGRSRCGPGLGASTS